MKTIKQDKFFTAKVKEGLSEQVKLNLTSE